jgi:hypothetical protein
MAKSIRSAAMGRRSSCLLGLALVALAACSSDGRQLKDPVFDLPTPPVTEPVTAPATLATLPPLTELLAPAPTADVLADVELLIAP